MASGVNVKMGVTGVSQFKQNINQAKSAVKTLDAQLALTEKQFKASGDAEEYMAKKTAELQAKLEAQKSIVDNAESALKKMTDNGVDRASKAYQDLYQQMLKAKSEMLDTEMQMQNIETAGDDAANGVSDLNHQLEQVGQGINLQNVTSALGTITDGMEKVIARAWKMGQAIIQNTLGAGAWADELKTTADKFKITPEELQRMRKTANLIDTDAETILDARDKLKKGLEGADKDVMGLIAAAGFDPNGMSNEDVFWKLGEYIANLGSEEDQVKQSTKAFGKSWRELLPLFNAGREEYDETMESWSVVSDEAIDNLGKMDDQYQKLTGEWETFKNELLSTFAGPLTEGMEKLTGFVKELNNYLETPQGKEMLQQMGETITQLINDLTNVSPEDVVNGLTTVVDGIKTSLEWIEEHRGAVVGTVYAFIGAWGLLKFSEGVTTVIKLIDGIKGLTTGGAAAGAAAGTSWGTAFAGAVLKAAPWLLGLYEILKPSAGSDALGDNTLFDENGNLTPEGQRVIETNGSLTPLSGPDEYEITPLVDKLVEDKLNQKYTGDVEDAEDRNRRVLASNHAWEELQASTDKMNKAAEDLTGGTETQKKSSTEMSQAAGTLQGMPAQVYSAIIAGMSQIKIYVDGMQMGGALTPYINSAMNGALMGLGITK